MVGADGLVREKDKEAIQFVKNKIDSAKDVYKRQPVGIVHAPVAASVCCGA